MSKINFSRVAFVKIHAKEAVEVKEGNKTFIFKPGDTIVINKNDTFPDAPLLDKKYYPELQKLFDKGALEVHYLRRKDGS